MQEVNLLDNRRRQRLALTSRQGHDIAAGYMAPKTLRAGAPDPGCYEEDHRSKEDGSSATAQSEWHADEIANPHEQGRVCQEVICALFLDWILLLDDGEDRAHPGTQDDGRAAVCGDEYEKGPFLPRGEVQGVYPLAFAS